MRDALAAHDQSIGLGRAGPLQATAHEAASATKLRIVAERTLPSGTSRTAGAVGAVPDDAPGGERVCDGEGIARRCVAGMPVGGTLTGHGTSSLGVRLRVWCG